MSRLVVVSNRVAPITEGEPTAGGLAAGVLDALKQQGGIWFGWSGEITDDAVAAAHVERTVGSITLYTVDLCRRDYDEFYRGFANGTLWPTLHYQVGHAHFDRAEFAGYRRVNALFAQALARLVRPDDLIWAHDYHLLCLAEALREAGLRNRMGLFLHTPFPAPSVFMTDPAHAGAGSRYVPVRSAGLPDGRRSQGVRRLCSAAGRRQRAGWRAAEGVRPHGEDRRVSDRRACRRSTARGRGAGQSALCVAAAQHSLLGRPLILSVDRLDYSKGLRPRFIAFEQFLERFPQRQGNVVFMQIAPPSRGDIETYREIRHELEAEAGRINGRFAEVDWMPLRYLNRGFARSALMPLYAEAQVGLVTPLRDGMNLVAKEYVAAQDPDDPGVLVLSQFAGAARELDAALIVNPYDEAGVAAALDRALAMGCDERRERHTAMMAVMRHNSLDAWRDRFEADLRA